MNKTQSRLALMTEMKPITDVGEGPWRTGFPSEPGWYNASTEKNKDVLRWYTRENGWSLAAFGEDDEVWACMCAVSKPPRGNDGILWRPLKAKYRARQDALRGKA